MYNSGEGEPRVASLISAMDLNEEVAVAIGLDRPKDAYNDMTLDEVLAEKSRMATAIYPHIESVWSERDISFVVVCGTEVFKSYDNPSDFDSHGFADLMPTKFLMMHRPVVQNSPISVTR